MRCFLADITASNCAFILLINRNTINRYYRLFREIIIEDQINKRHSSSIDTDDETTQLQSATQNQFKWITEQKIIIIGVIKKNGNFFTKLFGEYENERVRWHISPHLKKGADMLLGQWREYDALIAYGYSHKSHVTPGRWAAKMDKRWDSYRISNVISFWSFVKRRLYKFHKIDRKILFYYFLESEWRFNNQKIIEKDFRKLLIKRLRRQKLWAYSKYIASH